MAQAQAPKAPTPWLNKRVKAILETNLGSMTLELYGDKTPLTVSNFIGLATEKQEFADARTGEIKTGRFYDGLVFHRVIPGFMIQGGDPLGKGYGGPGYQFEDEIVPGLAFERTGLLAMANSGPGTNGSQFFITVEKTPYLTGKHTIFGHVEQGYDIVEKISNVATDSDDRPRDPVVINSIKLMEGQV